YYLYRAFVCEPASHISAVIHFGVALAEGSHLFPFRTEKLSPPAPMVLPGKPGGRVGRRPIRSIEEPRNLSVPGLLRFQIRHRATWRAAAVEPYPRPPEVPTARTGTVDEPSCPREGRCAVEERTD